MRKISLKEKNYKLALGTVNFGLKYGIKSNSKVSFKHIKKIIKTSFNNNVNYIDTSQAYNNAEKILGKFNLKKFNIITKIKFYKKNINFPEEETFAKINKSLSLIGSASLKFLIPLCLNPNKSPKPLSFISSSAIKKPSFVFFKILILFLALLLRFDLKIKIQYP